MDRVIDIFRNADDKTFAQLLYRLAEYGKGCPYPTDLSGNLCTQYDDCEECFYDWLTHHDSGFIPFRE